MGGAARLSLETRHPRPSSPRRTTRCEFKETGRLSSGLDVSHKEEGEDVKMKRLGVVTAFVIGLAARSASVALATITTTTNSANAPNGTHYKSGTASCSVSGTTVTCSGYTLAGV